MEKQTNGGKEILYLLALILVFQIGIGVIIVNKFDSQIKEFSILNEKITDIHNLYIDQIKIYKFYQSLVGLPLQELNLSEFYLDNDSINLCNNTLLFFSSPSSIQGKYLENQLNKTGIPYKKVCKAFTGKDREICAQDKSYIRLMDSDTLIIAYQIEQVPQLIWNCSQARIGTLAQINETTEYNDLTKIFGFLKKSKK